MVSTTQPETRCQLPGFGLPLDHVPKTSVEIGYSRQSALFPNALSGQDIEAGYVQLPFTTLREFTMMHLMNQLTDKPDWHKKVFDEEIVAKWQSEALSDPGKDITESMVKWCIEELRYKAPTFLKTGAVSVYNGDVVKSDSAIPLDLKEELKMAVVPLEQVPARQKDWHPGSDEKVLDLVHPSLFPLVYGKSRILPDSVATLDDCIKRSGEGVIVPVPEENKKEDTRPIWQRQQHETPYSRKFQWLPCEVDVSGGEGTAKITSYINNLHPAKNPDLYAVVEKIVSRVIPLWNLTLTPLKTSYFWPNRIQYDGCEFEREYGDVPEDEGPQQDHGEDDDAYEERRGEWWKTVRKVIQPEPKTFTPPTVPSHMENEFFVEGTKELKSEKRVDIYRDYKERGLQVIVKLANIHLTPEKPEYGGGTWHVEGQLNEHICASAIYYFDSENITTSRLAFRQQCETPDEDISYEQDVHDWLPAVFGCEQEEACIQNVGSVDTPEGRVLTWPNILQHQVQPFKLADPTKPGHRKILALFLVDPGIRIISTANIPCQRRDWWSEVVREKEGRGSIVSALPRELQDQVFEGVEDFPLSMEEAKELRLKLMEERKISAYHANEAFHQHSFSLCEH